MSEVRIIVSGGPGRGRSVRDRCAIEACVESVMLSRGIAAEDVTVVHSGGAIRLDYVVMGLAGRHGWGQDPYLDDWGQPGLRVDPVRVGRMVSDGADLLLLLPGGLLDWGSRLLARRALKAGIETRIIPLRARPVREATHEHG